MDPRVTSVRASLRKTALDTGNSPELRLLALQRLSLAPPEEDTLFVAKALSSQGTDRTPGERLLAESAIAALARLKSNDAREALSALAASSVPFKSAAARAVSQ